MDTLKHSKSQETVNIVSQMDSIICPVKALNNYLRIRPEVQGSLFIHKNKKPVTRNAVTNILRVAMAKRRPKSKAVVATFTEDW